MADPLFHATQGALLMLAPFISKLKKKSSLWLLALFGGTIGSLPDLLGLYGFSVLHDHGRLYESAHHGAVKDILKYLPMYSLHLAADSLTSNPQRQWYGWNIRFWIPLIFWLINIALILWFVRIWNKNHAAPKDTSSKQAALYVLFCLLALFAYQLIQQAA